ncbi:MAG TPA: FGGY-family carbohydrate kinase [Termitinemataceae bacterium]|nr:FGGY-family carbohydrate kinase [Termitinemataceae bacterium]HOM23773.1 FGGY-family carbohydrate kinase [Termitinemataceae bacterium]HPQ00812.1 FGGY-family carbohydrate kinase [Termitinemataceae bacterium]
MAPSGLSKEEQTTLIANGKGIVGIEFGSTRIKATLIAPDGTPLASGSYEWENKLVQGIWTYDEEEIWKGLASCYQSLAQQVQRLYGLPLQRLAALGFSGMMHGYMVFDREGKLLVPFRTWRNNITGEASKKLTELFRFNIPQRWSIAHLYQSMLEKQEHLPRITYMTTLAGYVHWKLTGEKVVGVGEASGIFPIDPATGTYDRAMVAQFDSLVEQQKLPWRLLDILPRPLPAGTPAGNLSAEGARLLDPSGNLKPGIPLCPPEGDAGTGMVATNSIRANTGNVSAGTSVFAMIVLDRSLSQPHEELDIVVTPDGKPVGMAHSNNGSSELDDWIGLFHEVVQTVRGPCPIDTLYETIPALAVTANATTDGLLHIGYHSGEHLTGFTEGRPLFARTSEAPLALPNFVRSILFSSLCALRIGLDVLYQEGIRVKELRGHGGFFKRGITGQKIMAAATGIPVSTPATAGEGGAWGMALLAAYAIRENKQQSLEDFLDERIASSISSPVPPDPRDTEEFRQYLERYKRGLAIEREAIRALA